MRDRTHDRPPDRWRSTGRRLLGAVMLGVATILQPKQDPEAHWSDPPIVRTADRHDQATPDGPPDTG
jgi:hypothetical protein